MRVMATPMLMGLLKTVGMTISNYISIQVMGLGMVHGQRE